MLRSLMGLVLLAGCDVAFGLERDGHDEDGDGSRDEVDPCPQIAHESSIDDDGDGIPRDCDVDDATPSTKVFYAFDAGLTDVDLQLMGSATPVLEAIDFGDVTDPVNALTLDVDASKALIDIGFEVLDNAIDAGVPAPWSELGLYSVSKSFTNLEERGDVCFFGHNPPTPGQDPLYLETRENDDGNLATITYFPGTFNGTVGRMRHVRTPDRLLCAVYDANGDTRNGGSDVKLAPTLTGNIAIRTDHMRVRLAYVWIVYE